VPRSYTVTVDPLGRQVSCREDQSVLDACLRAGVWLPHSCTHGTCGTCKADLLEGDVDHGDASGFALMDFERDEGKLLLCQARPRSDLTIEGDVEVDEGLALSSVRDLVGTVVELQDIARDIRLVRIALDERLPFAPGQYVSLSVPGQQCTRTYSMANPPVNDGEVELHVRRTDGGLATDGWVFRTMAVGDRVDLSGPYGRFVFRRSRPEPVIMIAGGTGLAPMMSMIRDVLADADDEHVIRLYQGARTRADLYGYDELAALATQHPERFRYNPCLSGEPAAPEGFRTGQVTEVLAEDLPRCSGHVGYVCGPPGMVDAAMRLLMSRRLFPRDIYREDFFDESHKAAGGLASPLLKR
jgi:phenol hydroxylase P5 protein